MRTPAFWYQPRGWLAHLLLPLAGPYILGGWLRRLGATPYRSKIPVICVGNIVAGGAGKTPVALALAEMLKQAGHNPVFVTRGYGGAESGPLRVTDHHTAQDVGDEALLLARAAPVIMGRDRAAAIRLAETLDASHIVMDDGLQNPHVRARINLLVVDAAAGFGNGRVIPAGPLRETIGAAMKRVDAVILVGNENRTDSPPLEGGVGGGGGTQSRSLFLRRAPPSNSPLKGGRTSGMLASIPVLHAHLQPQLSPDFPAAQPFLAFAGIGRPEKFFATARQAGLNVVETAAFPDHHAFTSGDLIALIERASELNATLLTTEKDFMRLPAEARMQVEVLPVKLRFDDEAGVRQLLSITAPATPS